MKIKNENFLFDTENFVISLDDNPICNYHISITPKSFFSKLPFELLKELEIVIKILTTILDIKDFILLEQNTDDNFCARMHFIGNASISEQKFIEEISEIVTLKEGKNFPEFIKTIENEISLAENLQACFSTYQKRYLFCLFADKIFYLPEDFVVNEIPLQFFKSVFGGEYESKFFHDIKKKFENKVLIYSLLEFWIGRKRKLVRDKIPEIFAGRNKKIEFIEVDDDKYMFFLKRKLVEEVNEVLDALENSGAEHQQEEIGDVLEVIDAIKNFKNLSNEEIFKVKEDKKDKKGGFYKKIILHEN